MERLVLTEREEFLAKRIVHAAFTIHKELGPGLLEKVYESCLYHLLKDEGISVSRQVVIPVQFQELVFEDALRLDLLVDDTIVCEIKALSQVNPVWEAQIISQLKLANK